MKYIFPGLAVLLFAAPAAATSQLSATTSSSEGLKTVEGDRPVEGSFDGVMPAQSLQPNILSDNPNSGLLPPTHKGKLTRLLNRDPDSQASAEPSLDNRLSQIETEQSDIVSPDSAMDQVTSVSQLQDVQPSDWAFGALQNLIERYGCIAGYPDGTFRGNRAITRYEFAAGLNACLERINELIAAESREDYVTQEDLAVLQKLQAEFAAELAGLRGRVDVLENRTAQLEVQQFSPTAVFGGEVIFALSGAAGGDPPGKGDGDTVLTHLTRLGIVTSFTGKDRLRLELATGNFDDRGFANPEIFNSDMTLLSYQADLDNQIKLDKLEYRFAALNDRVVFTIRPVGFSLSSVLTANSPYFDAGRGAISRFTEASPVFKIGNLDAGVGFDWLVADPVRLQVAYGTGDSNRSDPGGGVFGADRSALGVQLLLKPAANVLTGLAYVNAYNSDGRLDTFTGSFIADTNGFMDEPAQIHAVSGTLQWRVNPRITFGTWGGLIFTNSNQSSASATTSTYLFSVGLSDPFGREGDLLAFLFGQPPKLVNGNGLILGKDEDTSLHFEAFYRFRITDNVSISPGFFLITNPEHDSDNSDIFIGTIRTTFRF
ncbi:iron uptake porin [Microcoleus sp. FACHB-672]|uniref:iron uptake porin n=1 Tax=Microcoleus sp. FACHB-672 TaxID=2692825 RepID=UPI001F557BA1|nr:iron uptake porin [Microcoleus sp. FACHB-672]